MSTEQMAMDMMRRTTEAQERTASALERIAVAIEAFTEDVVQDDEPEGDEIQISVDMAGRPIN